MYGDKWYETVTGELITSTDVWSLKRKFGNEFVNVLFERNMIVPTEKPDIREIAKVNKVQAIRDVMDTYNLGVKEAKEIVEKYFLGND